MLKKGASRKGMRRRQALASSSSTDEEDQVFPRKRPEPIIKLAQTDAAPAKEIARIEPKMEVTAAEEIPHRRLSEQAWGRQKPLHQHRGVWLFFIGAVVVMFAAIALVIRGTGKNTGTSAAIPLAIEVIDEEAPLRLPMPLYQNNPYQVQVRCTKILQEVAQATTPDTILPLARPTATLTSSLRRHWKKWESLPKTEQSSEILFDVAEVNGRDFLIMSGVCMDGRPFLAFFVQVNDQILIDWEASMATGEAKISTLIQNPTDTPITMRAVITLSPYYLPSLPEEEYESYQLTFPGSEEVIWGYAPRGSIAHQQIDSIILQQNELLEVVNEARVTLRLRKTSGPSSQFRFFITEVLHKDWVMP